MTTLEKKSVFGLEDIVCVGMFAAISFLGVQFFRIPMPAVVGSPFLHFGNIFLVLSALLLGGLRGGLASAIGFVIFDLLNGYVPSIPSVAAGCVLGGLTIGLIFKGMKRAGAPWPAAMIVSTLIGYLVKIVVRVAFDVVTMLIAGNPVGVAVIGAVTSNYATYINAVISIAVACALYYPFYLIVRRMRIYRQVEGKVFGGRG